MDDDAIFAGCTRIRLELADWLPTLTSDQLDTQSLCEDWTVREVAGHLVAALSGSGRDFGVEILRSGFRLNRANTALARRTAASGVDVLASALREHAGKRVKIPGAGARGPLADLVVHRGDMRIPLGLPMPAEPEVVGTVLDFLSRGSPGLVPRSRLAGLRLVGSDVGRSWREGEEVRGTLNDLLMAVAGRRATLHRLTGPGVALLAARI